MYNQVKSTDGELQTMKRLSRVNYGGLSTTWTRPFQVTKPPIKIAIINQSTKGCWKQPGLQKFITCPLNFEHMYFPRLRDDQMVGKLHEVCNLPSVIANWFLLFMMFMIYYSQTLWFRFFCRENEERFGDLQQKVKCWSPKYFGNSMSSHTKKYWCELNQHLGLPQ